MASIIVMTGAKNEYYPLSQQTYVIGRSEKLQIQVLDEYVSREHLRIRFDKQKNRYCAADMGSKHGVFINDIKIEKETVLSDEDRIRIGDTTIVFMDEDFPDSKTALFHLRKIGELENPTQIE